jgi:hypothetical protein
VPVSISRVGSSVKSFGTTRIGRHVRAATSYMRGDVETADHFVADARCHGDQFHYFVDYFLKQHGPGPFLKRVVAVAFGDVYTFSFFVYDHGHEVWEHWNVRRYELRDGSVSFFTELRRRISLFLARQRFRCFYCLGVVRDPYGVVHRVEPRVTGTVCGVSLPAPAHIVGTPFRPSTDPISCLACLAG